MTTGEAESVELAPWQRIEYSAEDAWGSGLVQNVYPGKHHLFCSDCVQRLYEMNTVWMHVQAPGVALCSVCQARHKAVGSRPKYRGRRY